MSQSATFKMVPFYGEYRMNEWMNEWMNERTNERTNERRNEGTNEFYNLYPAVKSEGQAQGCILRRLMVINPLRNDSPVRM